MHLRGYGVNKKHHVTHVVDDGQTTFFGQELHSESD
jgi:hypothetical protein